MAVINGRGTWGVRAFVQTGTWTRPADWLALNAPTDSTEQFTGLLAITNDDSNYVTLYATTTGSTPYSVDWGNGVVTTHASGTQAEYKYEYSAISESTLTSRGYKQVVVKLTGIGISLVQTYRPHSALSGATNILYTWLEFHTNLPNGGAGFYSSFWGVNGGRSHWVEKVTLNKFKTTSFSLLFADMFSLQEVAINCSTTGVTNTSQMFFSCLNLKSVPLFDTSNVTTANNMFGGCFSLTTIPSFNFGSVTNGSSMFVNCYSLTSVPNLNFGNATTLAGLFSSCFNLTTIAGLTTTNCQNFSSMFNLCYSLETVPLFDTSKGTEVNTMFYQCLVLTEIPSFNTSLVINFTNMFNGCSNLKTIPLLDTQKVATFTNAFANCPSLNELPAFNLTVGAVFNSMFAGTNGITKAPFINIRNTFSFVNQMLSRTAIVDIFNGLASGVTGKTITVSGNPGYGSLTAADRLIATAKGWTIA
jgi:hypothetical protein